MSAPANTYDEVPYDSHAFAHSHPDRLAATATLLGLRPPAVETARVLELGCASGGNLIPMAAHLPNATFVGVDLSVRQVVEGQDFIRKLGLGNIRIEHRSIMDVGDDFGTFDYIICHGVFSWVPNEVQDKIISICKRNLAPDGVAYVSYNTYPGWHMRGVIRDMMLFHSRQYPESATQINEARGIIDFFAKCVPAQSGAYGAFLQSELELIQNSANYYLFHDFMETHNTPVYFFDFNQRLESNGLRFLAESDLMGMSPAQLPKEVNEVLQRISAGQIYLEQYLDFLRNRMFRQTLICHADKQPNYKIDPATVAKFYIAAPIRPKNPQPNLAGRNPESFVTESGVMITVQDPVVKMAFAILSEEWPHRIPFHLLKNRARARLDPRPIHDTDAVAQDAQSIALALLQAFTSSGNRLLELSLRPLEVEQTPSQKPLAIAMNRELAAAGKAAVNPRHIAVTLGQFERQLLQHLDGQHDRKDLQKILVDLVRQNVLSVQKDGATVTDESEVANLIDATINQQLGRFKWLGLLVQQKPEQQSSVWNLVHGKS